MADRRSNRQDRKLSTIHLPWEQSVVRILFWGVNNRDLTSYVCSLADATGADVIVLNENRIPGDETLCALQAKVSSDYYAPHPASEERFHCFCRRRGLDLSEVHSGFRMSVRRFRVASHRLLLAFIHGVDMRNYDTETRQSFVHELSTDLSFVKEQQGTNRLVMIGDFNMNPYERGMNLAAGLNAMMTKACVEPGVRRHLNKDYDFYYNPMWSLFGDGSEGPAGTVYDTSNQGPYGWSMLDQAILNHSVVDMFEEVKILTEAGLHSLMNDKGHPDSRNVSDHFPILLTLRENANEYLLAQ